MTAALRAPLDAFLAQLRVERRLSPHTLAAYRRDLDVLLTHAEAQRLRSWREFGSEALRSVIAAEHRRGLSAKSLQRLLSTCRGFFRSQLRDGAILVDPGAGLRAPKAPRKLPQVLDPDEMTQLVELSGDAPLELRDRALLELFYSSGLRLSELCGLRWRDLDLADAVARVRGKGDKVRVVPVGSHARTALEAWGAVGGRAPEAPVFAGRGGAPISARAVQQRVKLAAQRQGIFKRVHPHLLRHSCASHVLESSGDLRGVQELLGHADIATTQIYTHLDFQHLARVYDAAHPRARRKPA
ncbi:tyrosine recombinase XerC [Chiayiivirga flava]|uniref:Tyrosine recombinase XerC n=1 Tax=Chiayiivirga flava TaxID=659595 RepID=A0A7W8D3V3_9GAMM|nr:tyrosine recombinase XerC [Chiayiivirga flava]MBB5207419.1 integrase/recombinase XerC [Chiayiivirga flava]